MASYYSGSRVSYQEGIIPKTKTNHCKAYTESPDPSVFFNLSINQMRIKEETLIP